METAHAMGVHHSWGNNAWGPYYFTVSSRWDCSLSYREALCHHWRMLTANTTLRNGLWKGIHGIPNKPCRNTGRSISKCLFQYLDDHPYEVYDPSNSSTRTLHVTDYKATADAPCWKRVLKPPQFNCLLQWQGQGSPQAYSSLKTVTQPRLLFLLSTSPSWPLETYLC